MDRRRPDYDDNRVVTEYRAWVLMMAVILGIAAVFAIVGEVLTDDRTDGEHPPTP